MKQEQNILKNYINGQWISSETRDYLDITNPATGEMLGKVPLSGTREINQAATAAEKAFREWRRVPAGTRIQHLYQLKNLIEANLDDLARTITMECGKTLSESRGELLRAIENVEVACGTPLLMQGYNSEDIASGIDEIMIRQPVGVTAVIAPFNFPAMIPFWFMPYSVACGNTCIIKPSEKVPVTMQKIFTLIEQAGFPAGVVNMVNGSGPAVDAILDHPVIRSISFVGSTPVAKYVYQRATANGKRAQCSGGAKNPIIVLPDADPEMTTRIVADSAFGCAGQRCLAASLAITVGESKNTFADAISEAANAIPVGNGLDENVKMGPIITPESKSRIENLIEKGLSEGSRLLVDGRKTNNTTGNFLNPTIIDQLDPGGTLAKTEIFGPVLGIMHVDTIEDAISLINSGAYGNMACLFTNSGANARQFRYEAEAGNIGINIGVAAPIAFFPFSGWKESFFGDLHGQGRDAIEFFTRKKVVVERWPKEWNRQF